MVTLITSTGLPITDSNCYHNSVCYNGKGAAQAPQSLHHHYVTQWLTLTKAESTVNDIIHCDLNYDNDK